MKMDVGGIKKVCEEASKNGHLECLKYAHENGCPWDAFTVEAGIINGKSECVNYAIEKGCPCHLFFV